MTDERELWAKIQGYARTEPIVQGVLAQADIAGMTREQAAMTLAIKAMDTIIEARNRIERMIHERSVERQ